MAIELIDKIKQKNNGTFKLVDAIDVELSSGKDVESVLIDHIENHPASGTVTTNVHVSNNPPENESLTAWIDTSDDEEFMKNVSDLVLDEFRSIFSTMQEQITALRVKNSELEARIYYLELYGSGNSGVTNGNILVLEDSTVLTLEDGTVLTFE